MESDARFFRRRATEELNAANRAVTQAARDRREQLAKAFLDRLEASQNRPSGTTRADSSRELAEP